MPGRRAGRGHRQHERPAAGAEDGLPRPEGGDLGNARSGTGGGRGNGERGPKREIARVFGGSRVGGVG